VQIRNSIADLHGFGTRAPVGFLVYAGEHEQTVDRVRLVNFKNRHKMMDQIHEEFK